jgi:hypothetical protein
MNRIPERPTGFNLGGWMSQSPLTERHVERFIVPEDLSRIASWGFDSVRFPVDGEWLFESGGRGSLDERRFATVLRALGWMRDAGLHVMLDVHETPWHSFARSGQHDLWRDPAALAAFSRQIGELTRRLKGWDAPLWLDVLNEPVACDPADWNRVLASVVPAAREADAGRVLVLESARWGHVQHLEALADAFGGGPTVLSFHFYEPLFVTHQHARWLEEMRAYGEDVPYPGPVPKVEEYLARPDLPASTREKLAPHRGRVWDKAALRELLAPAAGLIRRGLAVNCGEFGVIEEAPRETRLNWTRDVVDLFREMGIGWHYWTYRAMDFGVCSGPVPGPGETLLKDLLDVLKEGVARP